MPLIVFPEFEHRRILISMITCCQDKLSGKQSETGRPVPSYLALETGFSFADVEVAGWKQTVPPSDFCKFPLDPGRDLES